MADDPEDDVEWLPDLYTNATTIQITLYDFALSLGLTTAGGGREEVGVVRMSPQHALVLTGLLMKHIRLYEHSGGNIPLLPEAVEALSLTNEITAIRGLPAPEKRLGRVPPS